MRRWVIFKFENKEDKERILFGGPYFMFGILLLKHVALLFAKDGWHVPTWVQIYGFPSDW